VRLRAVQAEEAADEVVVPRSVRLVASSGTDADGAHLYDLGARLPVEAVRVRFATTNSVAPVVIESRDSDKASWRRASSATFHRLTRDGVESESSPTHLTPRAERFWRVRVDAQRGGVGSQAPQLEISWRAAELVFVARGEAPFTLAFGHRDLPRAAMPLPDLIPGYRLGEEAALPVAQVGAVESMSASRAGWRRFTRQVTSRRFVLWSVLLGGVALLGVMARRLAREMHAKGDA
jgi:hypothetical protein